MNKKRILAILGAVALLAVFCLPMVFALSGGENAAGLFRASLGAAIGIPILTYIFIMAYRIFGKKKDAPQGIKNVIFDVGNVLVSYDWEGYLHSFGYDRETEERLAKVIFLSDTWNQRDKGEYPDEHYTEEFIKAAPDLEKEIREVLRRSPSCISPRDYAVTWTKYLRSKGYHLYVLSNYCEYMLSVNSRDFAFLKNMDGAIFSCQVKMLKPEPEIYQKLLDTYKLKADECVFIDDRKENCQAARALGIKAIVFESLTQAADALEALGVS